MSEIGVLADERELGLLATDLAGLRVIVGRLPFEMSFSVISRVAASHWHMRTDAPRQLALLELFLSDHPDLLSRYRAFAASTPDAVLIAEQQLYVLLRLLITDAPPGKWEQALTPTQTGDLLRALAACATLVTSAHAHLEHLGPEAEEWLRFVVQSDLYNRRDEFLPTISRTFETYAEIPRRPDSVAHHSHVDIDALLVADLGLDVFDQIALGFAAFSTARGLDEDVPANERGFVQAGYLRDTGYAAKESLGWDCLAATRDWYRSAFLDAGDDLNHILWDIRPFLARPFLDGGDSVYRMISPRAVGEWIGDGVYYRALDAAGRRSGKCRKRFGTFNGHLMETYALGLAHEAFPRPRYAASGLVSGEQGFGKSDDKTSDIAIDFGRDLVLIEIVARRLRFTARALGDIVHLEEDLDRTIFQKVRQMDDVIVALLSGVARIPGVDHTRLRRIWPIIVSPEGVAQTPPFWICYDANVGSRLRQPTVQPVTILRLADFEELMGWAKAGIHLVRALEDKTAPSWRRRGWGTWKGHDPRAPRVPPPLLMEERFLPLAEMVEKALAISTI